MKKRILAWIVTVMMLSSYGWTTTAADAPEVTVNVNGTVLQAFDATCKRVVPNLVQGSTYLPAAVLANALGVEITWDAAKSCAIIGGEPVAMTAIGDNLLPMRTVCEALGCDVQWDNDAWTVRINSDPSTIYQAADTLYISGDGDLPQGVSEHGNVQMTPGIVGNAFLFDGQDSYLQLPDNVTRGVHDFTIGAWVRFDALRPDVWQRVFQFGDGFRGHLSLGMWQYNRGNNIRGAIATEEQGSHADCFGAFELGEWVYYALVQKGGRRTLYVNGRATGSCDAVLDAGDLGDTTANYIGKSSDESHDDLSGAVDEFFFAKSAMSEYEVRALAFAGMSEAQTVQTLLPLVQLKLQDGAFRYFAFDDGKSTVTWTSDHPELLTVDGLKQSAAEPTEVCLTAHVQSGAERETRDFRFVVDGDEILETTLEKIRIEEMRLTAQPLDTTKYYQIRKAGTTQYLAQAEDALTLTEDAAAHGALWRFADTSTKKAYAVFNVENGKCLDVLNAGRDKGTSVLLYGGGKGGHQRWYVIETDGGVLLLNYISSFFFSDADGFTQQGLDAMTTWELVEAENTFLQRGTVFDEASIVPALLSDDHYVSFESKEGYLAAGEAGLTLSATNDAAAQWQCTLISDGFYTLTNRESGKNINISGGSAEAGAKVITWNAGHSSNEQWAAMETEDGIRLVGRNNRNALSASTMTMEENATIWHVVQGEAIPVVESTDRLECLTDYVPTITEEIDPESGFVHPGIMIVKEDIERMQRHVHSGDQPWTRSFATLAKDATASLTPRMYAWDGNGDTTALLTMGRLKNLRNDATTATNQAIMYVVTGDERYRTNAMRLLRKWSELRDAYRELGSDRIDHGVIAFKMAFAAELMKYSSCESPELVWTEEDNEKFIGVLETIRPKHSRTYHWMNQHGICNQGTLASAIFCNDKEEFSRGVQRTTTNPENGGTLTTQAGTGGGITEVFRHVTHDAYTGDLLDEPTFVHVEMGRDQGHAYGNCSALIACAMMAYKQSALVDPVSGKLTEEENGVPVFEFADHRLLEATNEMFRYNLGYTIPYPSTEISGYCYIDIEDSNRGNLYQGMGPLYLYYRYDSDAKLPAERTQYLEDAYERCSPEPMVVDNIGLSALLYTPDEAIETEPKVSQKTPSNATTWQIEGFSALLYGAAENHGDYVTVTLDGDGTRLAETTGYYPPSVRDKVILRVRTTSEVRVQLKNEHLVYAPFVDGVIPNTNGEWQSIAFDVQREGRMGQRIFFFTFSGEGTMDFDYMRFY